MELMAFKTLLKDQERHERGGMMHMAPEVFSFTLEYSEMLLTRC